MSRFPRLLATFAILGVATVLAACGNSTVTSTDANGVTQTRSVPFGSPITINVGTTVATPVVTLGDSDITGRRESLTVHPGDQTRLRVAVPNQRDTVLDIRGGSSSTPPPHYAVRPPPPPAALVEACHWRYGPVVRDGYGNLIREPYLHCP
jgi:hypothetical protein